MPRPVIKSVTETNQIYGTEKVHRLYYDDRVFTVWLVLLQIGSEGDLRDETRYDTGDEVTEEAAEQTEDESAEEPAAEEDTAEETPAEMKVQTIQKKNLRKLKASLLLK